MSDRYQSLVSSPLGKAVGKRLGLPVPPRIRRHEPGMPVVAGPVLLGGARGGGLRDAAEDALRSIGAHVLASAPDAGEDVRGGLAALVYDAGGIDSSERLRAVYDFFSPLLRRLEANGRVIVLAGLPAEAGSAGAAVAQRALEGFVRSVGKEVGARGSTAQLVRVANGGERAIESTLRFLLSARSAYVSGQVISIEARDAEAIETPGDWEQPLDGRVAAVTGAARGIGEAIAETLARDGAEVVCVDVPAQGAALSAVANRIGGTALQLDITGADAGPRLADHAVHRHGRFDVVVHNAGITRDRTLARMSPQEWDSVIAVNLTSQERISAELLDRDLLGAGGRIVCVSSVSGIAGNRGQANYATSKAGVIGLVETLAGPARERGATANAVAPGFIETAMTKAMPLGIREAGRRMNSLAQGGHPADVAETVAWLASPGSGAVNGNVVRVCGQALLGA
ncbi:MAG TPA: 3-oxoacyl-ACP reductase [Solirubrobacterales bacterium]|nr:3-oxoacyl-ACP reductase [Solirubrobacterales bacterium]